MNKLQKEEKLNELYLLQYEKNNLELKAKKLDEEFKELSETLKNSKEENLKAQLEFQTTRNTWDNFKDTRKQIFKEQDEIKIKISELNAEIERLENLKVEPTETTEPKKETIEPKKEITTTIIKNESLPPIAIFGIVSGALGGFVMIVLITIFFKNNFKKLRGRKWKINQ